MKQNLSVSCIRALAIDTINKANSGHPGMALGSAPIVYALFRDHLISSPKNPKWINRDRFVLSAGHASSLLYVMLHLCSYDLSIDDLKQFRQVGSKTPGHPECDVTPGVDATSGPLGQGIAQAVGMAIAETHLRAKYPNSSKILGHYTYCLCGDGCLQEGISQEAISLAGLYKLNKLILLYDCNDVTLDGPLSNSTKENTLQRFISAGWNVIEVRNGNNPEQISEAIAKAKEERNKPTLIKIDTIIGYGSANQGTCKVHGAPLGKEDGANAKASYNYNHEEFTVPNEVYDEFDKTFVYRGEKKYKQWLKDFENYSLNFHNEYNEINEFAFGNVVNRLFKDNRLESGEANSTRLASQVMLNLLHNTIPCLVGGSADVAKSVMTNIEGATDYSAKNRAGRNFNFGIREFAMGAITNGMILHGGIRTYVGCFLVFADYMKASIRMAALSKIPNIFLFSHDSIAVGEDGPTHQPIEQLAMLRSIPNVNVFRPCDVRELASAYKIALTENEKPSCLILTRQKLPNIDNSNFDGVSKGGYIISPEQKENMFTIIASGSEVSLAIQAQKLLREEGIDTRVVSMVAMNIFDSQDEQYKKSVLGSYYTKRIAVEMLTSFGWHKYAKNVMSIDTFGMSGKDKDVIEHFDFTAEHLVKEIKNLLQ